MLQDGLHGLERFGLGNAFLDHLRRELLDDFAVLHHLLDKAWTHHLTIIGNGIIEGNGINRGNLCLVTDRHPWQRGRIPVVVIASVLLAVRHADDGWTIAWQDVLQFQVFGNTHALETFYIALRLFVVELVDDMAHTDVRTDFQRAGYIDVAIAATAPVVVFHLSSVHGQDTATRMDDVVGVHYLVV